MKKPPRRPIYFVVVQAIDEKTGERFGALRPLNAVDQRAMRERKYAVGTEVRAELKKPRNVKFHRLAHALGALVVDQIDAFVGLTAHDALKGYKQSPARRATPWSTKSQDWERCCGRSRDHFRLTRWTKLRSKRLSRQFIDTFSALTGLLLTLRRSSKWWKCMRPTNEHCGRTEVVRGSRLA